MFFLKPVLLKVKKITWRPKANYQQKDINDMVDINMLANS